MTTKPRRIGPKMAHAVAYVLAHPGCSKLDVARATSAGDLRNMQVAYGPVNRAIRAGLVRAARTRKSYQLTVQG